VQGSVVEFVKVLTSNKQGTDSAYITQPGLDEKTGMTVLQTQLSLWNARYNLDRNYPSTMYSYHQSAVL
jgi:hypothetical protein